MTQRKILIAYDGSDCAEAALDDLQRAGLPPDAEALVLSVAEVWLPPAPATVSQILEQGDEPNVPAELRQSYARGSEAMREANELSQRARQRVQVNHPKWKVTAEASYGSPAWEVIAKADRWQPDLVLVGSHGRTAVGRFVLGSVSQRVLTEASCSVRVARGRVEEPDQPVRIVVGLDGSEPSLAAAGEVATRFWPPNSEIKLIVVDNPLVPSVLEAFLPTVEEANQEEEDWAKSILMQGASLFNRPEWKVTTEVKRGDPKRVLVKTAEDWNADSIFVGSTGFSNRFERFVLGSVSAAVVARAHCTVEVVRKGK
ncbi:MAG TPA: universal stress protein [Pyrinomonadaceae bacterium]|nr:universal stress protein [Pyrinomonadaceae bacterium]